MISSPPLARRGNAKILRRRSAGRALVDSMHIAQRSTLNVEIPAEHRRASFGRLLERLAGPQSASHRHRARNGCRIALYRDADRVQSDRATIAAEMDQRTAFPSERP